MLEYVFPIPPVLENLKTLQIKFCDKAKRVFKRVTSQAKLPELTSVGAKLPALDVFYHNECPKLKDTKESLMSRMHASE
ncbi:conserved hypothetical protein [Ricinus communis]|uniref:Uncharacterized protein n=1 Tax=Ricinus communis TaxID=3988 RepID=B9S1J6_RICCO|nr:conserved hypothetical protein [Ricinus communis]